MKTQKITLLVVLMVLSAALAASAGDFVSIGYGDVATQTITLTASTTPVAAIIGTIPTGRTEVEVIVTGGAANYGPAGVTSASTWPYIASGSQKIFDMIGVTKPKIYFIQRGNTVASPPVNITIGIVAR